MVADPEQPKKEEGTSLPMRSGQSVRHPNAKEEQGTGLLDLSSLPSDVQEALKTFDADGDGIHVDDIIGAADKWKKSQGNHDSFSLCAFPEDLQPTLAVFDQDGDGSVCKAELAAAAKMYMESQRRVKYLIRTVVAVSFGALILLCVLFGLMFASNEASKETHTEGNTMVSLDGEAVAVDSVESFTGIFDIPRVPLDVIAKVKTISMYVDMSKDPNVQATVESVFHISSAFKVPLDVVVHLRTSEGYSLLIDGDSKTGRITMGSSTFNISDKLAGRRLSAEELAEYDELQCGDDEPVCMPRARRLGGKSVLVNGVWVVKASFSVAVTIASQAYNVGAMVFWGPR